MCTPHIRPDISRRRFVEMTIAAAGASLLPLRGWAAGHTEALCLMCIDYRLVNGAVEFFNKGPWGPKADPKPATYDIVALAGASLAGVLTRFPEAVPGFWKQIELAKQLHDIKQVVVLDHMKCGAYEQQFNGGNPMQPEAERTQHRNTMSQVKLAFRSRFPTLELKFFLMEVNDDKPGPINPVNA